MSSEQLSGVGAWRLLERYVREIQGLSRSVDQIRKTLEALRESLPADTVLWYPASAQEELVIVGSTLFGPELCRELVQCILQCQAPEESQMCFPALPARLAHLTVPLSLVMVRISKAKPAWLVALCDREKRIYGEEDLQKLLFVRRLLLSQRQQTQMQEQLKSALFGFVHCLTAVIDAKDPYTSGHSERVARIAVRLAQQMQLPEEFVGDIYLAGLLHDLGKIAIRDSVLLKQGSLSAAEYAHVQEHPVIGARILGTIDRLAHLCPAVRHHHERFDGRGYPDHLVGENIPLAARILAVADACDAMMSPRAYRPVLPQVRMERVLEEGMHGQWDPEVISCFMACREEVLEVAQKGIGDSVFHALDDVVDLRDTTILQEQRS